MGAAECCHAPPKREIVLLGDAHQKLLPSNCAPIAAQSSGSSAPAPALQTEPRPEVIPDLEEYMAFHKMQTITEVREAFTLEKAMARLQAAASSACCDRRSARERILPLVRLVQGRQFETGEAQEAGAAQGEHDPTLGGLVSFLDMSEETATASAVLAAEEELLREAELALASEHLKEPKFEDWDFSGDGAPTLLLARYKALPAETACRERGDEELPESARDQDSLGLMMRLLQERIPCCSILRVAKPQAAKAIAYTAYAAQPQPDESSASAHALAAPVLR